jgi:predicted nucleic acid-binding protein
MAYVRDIGIGQARGAVILRDVRGRDVHPLEQERLEEVFAGFQRLLTTPHILTEAFRLRKYSELRKDEYRFREVAINVFKRTAIQEITASLGDFTSNQDAILRICQLGLTDAILLHVSAKENCTVLTDDQELLPFGLGRIQLLNTFLQLA